MAYTPAMLWVDTAGLNTLRWSRPRMSGPDWSSNGLAWDPGLRASAAPALAWHGGRLHAAWVDRDQRILSAVLQAPDVWSAPADSGFRTRQNPAIASHGGRLYLAWKDVAESSIRWAPSQGSDWGAEVATSYRTATGPALAHTPFGLYLSWRGYSGDTQLHWSKFNGSIHWFDGPDNRYPGWTNTAPALAGTPHRLYLAWRGQENDTQLWWATFDGVNWTDQRPIVGWSTTSPALATRDETVFMVWTERFPDEGHGQLWWSQTTPAADRWAGQQRLGARRSFFSPAIA